MFVIVQCRVCPALMVPVASSEPGAGSCTQSPEKLGANKGSKDSVTVKLPGPNVTVLLSPLLRVNEDGRGLLSVTVMGKLTTPHAVILPGSQTLLISKVPVAGGVTVVVPSGHVSATAQDASACLCLASAVLLMVLSLDASEAELELLLAVFLF